MSKRLRSSLRTRGRLLRPRSAQPRPDEEFEAQGGPEADEAEGDAHGEPSAADTAAAAPVTAAAAATSTVPETATADAPAEESAAQAELPPAPRADDLSEIQACEPLVIQSNEPVRKGADGAFPEPVAETSDEGRAIPDGPEDASAPIGYTRVEDEGSVPPVSGAGETEEPEEIAQTEDDEPAPEPLSPAMLARRARLRRVVGAIVGFAGVLAVMGVGKAVLRPSAAPIAPPPTVAAAPVMPAEVAPATAKSEPPAAQPTAQPAPAAQAEPTSQPAEPPAAEAKAPDPAEAKKLQKEALSFLNRGKRKDAIEAARAAIAADPSDALSYLYLGSALQDSGKWKDGIAAYSDCVRNATRGPVHECAAMGGRK